MLYIRAREIEKIEFANVKNHERRQLLKQDLFKKIWC